MLAKQLLLSIRSKLRDRDFESLRHSDNELLDLILVTQNMLILHFNYNILEFNYKESQKNFILPKPILSLKKILSNNKEIPIKTSADAITIKGVCAFVKGVNTIVLNTPLENIRIYANCGENAIALEDSLILDDMFFNALVLGVLKRIVLTETGIDNLEKISPYEQLYSQEVKMLTRLFNERNAQKAHFSKCTLI